MSRNTTEKINIIDFIIEINNNHLFANAVEENEISELPMHKILYIIYGSFYSKFKKVLFDANFEAWKYGPVEIEFRKYFNKKISISDKDKSKFYDKFSINLNNREKNFLFEIIERLICLSPWTLVHYTHNTDPWVKNFNNKDNKQILNEQIWEWFKNDNLFPFLKLD